MNSSLNDLKYYELAPFNEKILYAEMHKKNYDIYFSVSYENLPKDVLEAAIGEVMNSIDSFKCRITEKDLLYHFTLDEYTAMDFRSDVPLKGIKIDIFKNERLARYFIKEDEQAVEFLFHHLVFDGDSLPLFLETLEKKLSGKSVAAGGESYFGSMTASKPLSPSAAHDAYMKELTAVSEGKNIPVKLQHPVTCMQRLSDAANEALSSLGRKLRMTKFGVLLFTIGLLSKYDRNLFGVVTSRKDKRVHSEVIGNFTDIVPYPVSVDSLKSYSANGSRIFRNLFAAIERSASFSYEEYMKIVGMRGFDGIISYTRMLDSSKNLNVFFNLELGEYLYKYDNHLQFQEFNNELILEYRCDNEDFQNICIHLDTKLQEIDRIDLSQSVNGGQGEVSKEPALQHGVKAELDSLANLLTGFDEEENIFDSGISSLEIAKLISLVHEKYGIQLFYQDIYQSKTIGEIKRKIISMGSGVSELPRNEVGESGEYILPNFLKPIFIDSFRFLHSDMYNVKYAFRLAENVQDNLDHFISAVELIVKQNEMFYTEFRFSSGNVIGKVSQAEQRKIELEEVEDLKSLKKLKSTLRIKGDQKLWDIRVLKVKDAEDIYLYINMHHLIVDDLSAGIFLSQIEQVFLQNSLPEFVQLRHLAGPYEAARRKALKEWETIKKNNEFANIGKPELTKGSFSHFQVTFPLKEQSHEVIEADTLHHITAALADVFNCPKGYIGAVYHGRVFPYADQVICSFARVLPVFFDRNDESVIRKNLLLARQNQAVSIYDLNEAGFSLEFPKIVFQTLVPNDRDSKVFTETMEFKGKSKFQIFFNLELNEKYGKLHIYMDTQIYSANEVHALLSRLQKRLDATDSFEMEASKC
ncbi:Phosphopantetheine attachment site [Bacillus sp. OV322]|uniref:condensation domain-containing protein n=1 Tax=Bacillus sp. OV322 TaxID=1882764 RepID=UPI0008E7692C|nr:condensation domain-containing protein [Bacillus sp. OV322]SFC55831.1 Phosphopantetheine attachment site [Bacillus sp. OV322]